VVCQRSYCGTPRDTGLLRGVFELMRSSITRAISKMRILDLGYETEATSLGHVASRGSRVGLAVLRNQLHAIFLTVWFVTKP